MKILVISDTHIPVVAKAIPSRVTEELRSCSLCLHAGDFIDYSVFEELSSYVETIGVRGNMDNPSVKKKFPEKRIISVENVHIALIHGKGQPASLVSYTQNSFADEWGQIDVIIFGHSHHPLKETIGGKLFLNPGSPTDTVFAPYASYGIIEIEGKKINSKIIRLNTS